VTREELVAYCLDKPGAWPDEPWEGDVVVKVAEKIFAFLGSPDGMTIGFESGADRDTVDEWREHFPVTPLPWPTSVARGGTP
jgi:predicted DNA-binding protein (MmcQ/YjbR family)